MAKARYRGALQEQIQQPTFVVPKKDGSLRIVQDFRALNTQTHVDKYSMHDVSECVAQIGRAGSSIFSTIDLTSEIGRAHV